MKDGIKRIILAKLKGRSVDDVLLEIIIDEVEETIRNYCNIKLPKPIPPGLKYTWANMAIDVVNYQLSINQEAVTGEGSTGDISSEISGEIKSLTIGDTKIELGSSQSNSANASAQATHKSNLDDLLMNYTKQLNEYRKLRW